MNHQIMRKRTKELWKRPMQGQLPRTKSGRRSKLSKWRRQPKHRRRQPRQLMQAMDQIQKPTNCTIEPCDQRVISEVKHLSKHVEQSSVTIAEAASMLQASADSKDDHKRQLLHAEVLQLLTQTSKEGKSMSTRVIDTMVKTAASVTINAKGGQHHCTHCQVAGHSIQRCRNVPRNNAGGAQGGGGGGQGAQNQPGRQQHANVRAPFGRQ